MISTAELNALDTIGTDSATQARLLSTAREISSNFEMSRRFSDDFKVTAEGDPAALMDFVKELSTAYPVYSANESFISASFIGRDHQYWVFAITKVAFLEINNSQ